MKTKQNAVSGRHGAGLTPAQGLSQARHDGVSGHANPSPRGGPTAHAIRVLHGEEVGVGDFLALEEQMRALDISASDVSAMQKDLVSGEMTFQQVFNLSNGEMGAMAYRGWELLRAGRPRDALKVFLALNKLNTFEGSYYRGAGMCFHHLSQFGFARGAYDLALVTRRDDRISEALKAECLVYLEGKQAASVALDELLRKQPTSSADIPYFERAKSIRKRLAV